MTQLFPHVFSGIVGGKWHKYIIHVCLNVFIIILIFPKIHNEKSRHELVWFDFIVYLYLYIGLYMTGGYYNTLVFIVIFPTQRKQLKINSICLINIM